MGRLLSLAVLGALAGCYVYEPLRTVEPQVGTRVSAELTGNGSDTLARSVGPSVTSLRGYLVSTENTNVVLSVTSVTDRYGQVQSWRGEQVRVPRVAIQDFQQRRFSLGRTLLLGAVFVGGSVAGWAVFKGDVRGGSLPGPGGGGVPK
jgi:hypothetical protein